MAGLSESRSRGYEHINGKGRPSRTDVRGAYVKLCINVNTFIIGYNRESYHEDSVPPVDAHGEPLFLLTEHHDYF
jgi:hypothetical protein